MAVLDSPIGGRSQDLENNENQAATMKENASNSLLQDVSGLHCIQVAQVGCEC